MKEKKYGFMSQVNIVKTKLQEQARLKKKKKKRKTNKQKGNPSKCQPIFEHSERCGILSVTQIRDDCQNVFRSHVRKIKKVLRRV